MVAIVYCLGIYHLITMDWTMAMLTPFAEERVRNWGKRRRQQDECAICWYGGVNWRSNHSQQAGADHPPVDGIITNLGRRRDEGKSHGRCQ